MSEASQDQFQRDLDETQRNRERFQGNRNLMHWYRNLYQDLFRGIPDIERKRILEIGSGTSPLKLFLPNVITTDILPLDHLDYVLDCHEIANFSKIPDRSIDVITLTNVLHHLRDPICFLRGAASKLAKGGQMLIVEPYFSMLSYPLFKFLHHETVDFNVSQPVLQSIEGPLSSANQAMPYMIFFSRPEWLEVLSEYYELSETRFRFFTSLAYMVTGGISKTFPIPHWIYRPYFALDRFLARIAPRLFASFFSVRLVARG